MKSAPINESIAFADSSSVVVIAISFEDASITLSCAFLALALGILLVYNKG